jgi:hypothetical protein
MTRTLGLLELPPSAPALRAELERLEHELAAPTVRARPARRLLAIERRRVVVRLDELDGGAAA